jgi:hypothetical protein
MDRTERHIRITSQLRPTLYIPRVQKTLNVQPGEVYLVHLSDRELAAVIEAKVAEEAPAGSFAAYHRLRGSDNQFAWEKVLV